MKNISIKSTLAIVIGIALGIFSKWGDVIPGDNLIKYFGWISTGVIIWLVIGSFIIIKSNSRTEFNIVYSLLMLSMLVSYYAFSAFVVKYLVKKVVLFWLLMLLGSLVVGNIVYSKRKTNLFRVQFIIASVFFLIFDAIEINGIDPRAVGPELLLVIFDILIINKSIKMKQ